MNYPLISEYVEAIKMAEDNLDQLSHLRPVLDNDGRPVMSSGNFAVVFKMRDERVGKFYALKCFFKDQLGRDEAYKLIADELEFVSSEFIIPIKFFEKELFVDTSNSDETEFPVLLMDWVEGLTLDKYVRRHLQDQYALQLISYQFCRVAAWLMAQPFAHGDLKPDNILVKDDGSLVLVDYDGMFVPAMKGQKAREIGSPDYRHPARTIDDFNESIDDFSLATIAMQLYAIALQPELLTGASGDTLMLCEKDYRDLKNSDMMTELFSQVGNPEFEKLLAIFLLAHSEMSLSKLSFRIFNINKPVKPIATIHITTEVTDEDIANGSKDEFGAVYSRDGKRLLKGPYIQSYRIRKGTQVICRDAFLECYILASITIPDSVTHIGDKAFAYCKGLTSVTIPNSATSIGDDAFHACMGLTSVTIPNSVTTIGNQAFEWCSVLTSVTIGNSVTTIGKYAFGNCSSLTNVNIHDLDAWCKIYFKDHGSNPLNEAHHLFINGTEITDLVIPSSVTSVGEYAFYGCYGLTSVTIPNSVTSIGDGAFCGCRGLACVTIPNSVTNIGDGAFCGCSGLASVTIPNLVTTVGEYAFYECKRLTGVTIPNSVMTIGNNAFSGCSSLTNVTVESGNPKYDSRENCNAIIQTENNTLIVGCKDSIIPSSVTHIGDGAFYGCRGLACVTIPSSVTSIGDDAFHGCSGLASVTIPNSVTSIGEYAFFGCSGLASVTIPNSVTSIGKYAFYCCSGLTTVSIPNSVTSIGWGAFSECKRLTSVDIGNSVTSIDEHAFWGCSGLTSVNIHDLDAWCKIDFKDSYTNPLGYAQHLFINGKEITDLVIPNSVTSIGDGAFEACSGLTSVTIPNSVTSIGNKAFVCCYGLTSVTIPNSVKTIGDKAFAYCRGLTSVTIRNSITQIDPDAFSGCDNLEEIIIPAGSLSRFQEMLISQSDVFKEDEEHPF